MPWRSPATSTVWMRWTITPSNPSRRYTFWSGVLGGGFLALSYFGTDQSQVGRYLSGGSLRESRLGVDVQRHLQGSHAVPDSTTRRLVVRVLPVRDAARSSSTKRPGTGKPAADLGFRRPACAALQADFSAAHAEERTGNSPDWLVRPAARRHRRRRTPPTRQPSPSAHARGRARPRRDQQT